MNNEFPSATASESEAPLCNVRPASEVIVGKAKVWVQTLNSIHKDQAEQAAHWYARRATANLRKGSQDWTLLMDEFSSVDTEDLIPMLVLHEMTMGRWHFEAMQKFPEPIRPERKHDMSDQDWLQLGQQYDEEVAALQGKRTAYLEKLQKEYEKRARSWTPKYRAEQAVNTVVESQYAQAYNTRSTVEILFRAVRKFDSHGERFYKSIEEVEDLDDEARATLVQKYQELDTVSSIEIPT